MPKEHQRRKEGQQSQEVYEITDASD